MVVTLCNVFTVNDPLNGEVCWSSPLQWNWIGSRNGIYTVSTTAGGFGILTRLTSLCSTGTTAAETSTWVQGSSVHIKSADSGTLRLLFGTPHYLVHMQEEATFFRPHLDENSRSHDENIRSSPKRPT